MKKAIRHIHLPQTGSTNRYLHDNATRWDSHDVWVTTDFQTHGRGQGTNSWESERGKNLLFSVLTHPHGVPAQRHFVLSMAGALALKAVLDSYMGDITLKWPNDVYYKDCKLSGTLIETAIAGGLVKHCIYGVGLNVNQQTFVGNAPNPVSMSMVLGREVDRDVLLGQLIDAFGRWQRMVDDGRWEVISDAYHAALYRRRGFHAYRDAGGLFMAAIAGVTPEGHLLLETECGTTRRYAFKEVEYVREITD